MSLNPIKALEQVTEQYRDYLLTEFRAKDPALKAALERELDKPGFLSQEPFYQAHRPFKMGAKWSELPIDKKLATVMRERSKSETSYTHQEKAIRHLLSNQASPVVVTTGTGSGKTECFLLPVIQNAIDDAAKFKKSGLTAILLYPMNALANDQKERIDEYLEKSGFSGLVSVAKYDRSTKETDRERLRKNPPHILLTNYMMLEYLLVRPKDREDIFANHRCRFLVLDEVHTYRGTLGSNIALLVRRLKAHLQKATQDWNASVASDLHGKRFPTLIPIGTSATIKSLDDKELSPGERERKRNEDIQDFFSKVSSAAKDQIKVYSEELEEVHIPTEAVYSNAKGDYLAQFNFAKQEDLMKALKAIVGETAKAELLPMARKSRLLWDLNTYLIKRPMSVSQIVKTIKEGVVERKEWSEGDIRNEVELALNVGAALPDDFPNALRLRAHRFIRGGWRFARCIDPSCGKLYPMGEEECDCGSQTAPLFLCRNCGADYLRFVGDSPNEITTLQAGAQGAEGEEWMLYQAERFELQNELDEGEDNETENGESTQPRGRRDSPDQMRGRPVLHGSFDVRTLRFSTNPDEYGLRAIFAPARNRCLCCGKTAGSRNVVSRVSLGTSAALKILAEGLCESLEEANQDRPGYDHKERILIFTDSRQDAAHQARFIIFASRYDRMRRRLVHLLKQEGTFSIQNVVQGLADLALKQKDNPYTVDATEDWVPDDVQERIQAYEEAPVLDELAVNAGYRATVVNLGLVQVSYHRLDEYLKARGSSLANMFGISIDQFFYLSRCLLDEMRTKGSLSRPLLQFHPSNARFPANLKAATWERRMKHPSGYACDENGNPVGHLDSTSIPGGIKIRNFLRRQGAGGRAPIMESVFRHFLTRFNALRIESEDLLATIQLLKDGGFIKALPLHGLRDRRTLLQVNSECVRLSLTNNESRNRCEVCSEVVAGAQAGAPCPRCHGNLKALDERELYSSRYVKRIYQEKVPILSAAEHTAQVANVERIRIEERFKSSGLVDPLNILACSPTLEMGIDVGGLDAILMRNIPPRPDNYAQRGGRAGRRSRVGLVIGYARSTPHDQYFYDSPSEMIAGEVATPSIALGNKDVIRRHLYAIVFGAAQPGLASKMMEYIDPRGARKEEVISELLVAIRSQFNYGVELAFDAWGEDVLADANISKEELIKWASELPEKVEDIFNRISRQVMELRRTLETYYQELIGAQAGLRAGELVARILGIPSTNQRRGIQDDDTSPGYPLRTLAEFGVLPGYEFPSQPAGVRLLGDPHEESPVSVSRRFGIAQYEPEATVYARARRWKVVGLDTSSPWNPFGEQQGWIYRICPTCNLRVDGSHPRCPRCQDDSPAQPIPSAEYAGFLARPDEAPVLDEEERYAMRSKVVEYPQWDGDVVGRWSLPGGWGLRLSRDECIYWLNEGEFPSESDREAQRRLLHPEAKGFSLCSECGHILRPEMPVAENQRGRTRPRRGQEDDPYGHSARCGRRGQPTPPVAISVLNKVEVLRLLAVVPESVPEADIKKWGLTLGYALRNGMRNRYSLEGSEIEFILEGPWKVKRDSITYDQISLTFIDPNIGGSGYLPRIAREFKGVAEHSIHHLDHANCESACYRCLKSYQNQRYHEFLEWPRIIADLEMLASEDSVSRPHQTGDIDDPRPWLEAYAAGVGSPLELKFLKLFQQYGLSVEKQIPVPEEAPISIADFAMRNGNKKIAIYIDGAAFHAGNNLRRDKFIREKLRKNYDFKVIELRAADLRRGQAIVDELKAF